MKSVVGFFAVADVTNVHLLVFNLGAARVQVQYQGLGAVCAAKNQRLLHVGFANTQGVALTFTSERHLHLTGILVHPLVGIGIEVPVFGGERVARAFLDNESRRLATMLVAEVAVFEGPRFCMKTFETSPESLEA